MRVWTVTAKLPKSQPELENVAFLSYLPENR
jgi:hypothetical protein